MCVFGSLFFSFKGASYWKVGSIRSYDSYDTSHGLASNVNQMPLGICQHSHVELQSLG